MKNFSCVLLIVLPLTGAFGQEPAPTPESVLQALKQAASESPGSRSAIDSAADLLRQAHGRYTEEELDAFANELEQIILAGVEPLATDAARVLVHSAIEFSYGIPYVNAANVLARVYESYRDSHPKSSEACSALRRVYRAQGQAYVIELFCPASGQLCLVSMEAHCWIAKRSRHYPRDFVALSSTSRNGVGQRTSCCLIATVLRPKHLIMLSLPSIAGNSELGPTRTRFPISNASRAQCAVSYYAV